MANWKTVLISNQEVLGTVDIKRGIFQGDSLSTLLFVHSKKSILIKNYFTYFKKKITCFKKKIACFKKKIACFKKKIACFKKILKISKIILNKN